jgi:uncharacterized membrane protein HdeD (DUF308 family)
VNNFTDRQLASSLSRSGKQLLLRGFAAIILFILTWVLPGISVKALVYLFGVFALADGILGVWLAIAARKEYEEWWALLFWGIVGIGAGILTIVVPNITPVAPMFFIAVWSIAMGVLEIVAAKGLRREIKGEWLLILGGLVTVAFGILLMVQSEAGALALIWLIGLYAVVFGIILITLAIRARRFVNQLEGA